MTTLKELLDSLEIKTDDLEEEEKKEEELDLTKVKLEDIPEAQRPIFKKLIDTTEQLKNDVATRDLAIKTIKQAFPKQEKKEPEKKEAKKIFGVLDPDDPYAPVFSKMEEALTGMAREKEVNQEEQFKTNLIKFAKEHKDIVRYANKMDEIVAENPTLMRNIPRLYNLAKVEMEGGEDKQFEHQSKIKKFQTERSGPANVKDTSNVKSISEAFDAAEKQINSRR